MQRNYTTLIVTLLGALKVVLSLVGIEIPDEHIDAIANGIGALLIVAGIVMQHVKKPKVADVEPSLPK